MTCLKTLLIVFGVGAALFLLTRYVSKQNFHNMHYSYSSPLGDNLGSPVGGTCNNSAGNTCSSCDACIPHDRAASDNWKDPKYGTCMGSGEPCAVTTKCFPQSFENKFCELGKLPSGKSFGYCENEHIPCSNDRGLRFYN